jgi:hypothetical protein
MLEEASLVHSASIIFQGNLQEPAPFRNLAEVAAASQGLSLRRSG